AGRSFPPEAFLAWAGSLAEEIRSSISYYQSRPGATAVDAVILSGRGARVAGLAAWLQENLGVPVTNARPLEGIGVPSRAGGDVADAAPDFAVCLSLARRGLGVGG
ncbi:MAG: pilus assembly protein PilM, partial [Bacillota bacterium]